MPCRAFDSGCYEYDNLFSRAFSLSLNVIRLSFYFSSISNALSRPPRWRIYSSRCRSLLHFISCCNLISTSLNPACRLINSHGNSFFLFLSVSRAVRQYFSFSPRILRREAQRTLASNVSRYPRFLFQRLFRQL